MMGFELEKLEQLKTPIVHNLWSYCLFEEIKNCKRDNAKTVEFSDVDKRVIELSKRIVKWEEADTIIQ